MEPSEVSDVMNWDTGSMGSWWTVMLVVMLAFWLTIAFAFTRLVLSRRAPRQQVADAAARLLADRLARGDIDPDDYQARLAALHGPARL